MADPSLSHIIRESLARRNPAFILHAIMLIPSLLTAGPDQHW